MTNDLWVAAVSGGLAGLGVAMPLGAIAALLLREGVVNGFRVAAAAAAGVATVDALYCAGATATGALLVGTIEGRRGVFLVVSGLLVIAVGVMQLRRAWRPRAGPPPDLAPASARAAFVRFVGLTAVNPLTLVYFVALGGAVAVPNSSWAVPVTFVAAAGLASLAWQLALASVGSLSRRVMGPTAVRLVGIGASLLVLGLGVNLLVEGVAQFGPT